MSFPLASSLLFNNPSLALMVTTEFEEVDGKTKILLQHVGLPIEISDDCMKGWQSSFDKLESNIK